MKSCALSWPYLWRYRRPLSRGFTALVLKDAAAALTPLLIRGGVDALTQGFRLERLVWFSVALAGLSAVKGLFQYWMRVILIGVSRDIEYDLRNDLFTRLIGLSRDFYSRFRTGDIMARATNDLNAVRMMLGPGIMYWSETSLLFVLAIAAMLTVDWPLTLMALAPAPLVSVAVVFFGRIIHDRFERIQKMFSDISQPGAGKPGRRPRGPRLRAGGGRTEAVRASQPRLHRAEHPAGAGFGHVHADAAIADRRDLSGGAVGRRRAAASKAKSRWARSSCSTPTWGCSSGP